MENKKKTTTTTKKSVKNNNNKNSSSKNNPTTNSNINTTKKNETNSKPSTTKTCTPKKFDFSFARADFESMEACQNKGNQYMEHGYGYTCSYFPDDCGTYYYMLTLYDPTDGKHYNNYRDVQIP